MTPLDYGRSFLMGLWPENEVRFWVESRTRIVDTATGVTEDYVQCGSCKSEDTFAERDLFYADNYDFLPVFGPHYGIIFRRKAWLNPNYRSCPRSQDMWGGQRYHLCEARDAQELTTSAAVIAAAESFVPIVAQTEISAAASGRLAVIEYPVKTLNTHRGRNLYQVDTGPVAFPDLSQPQQNLAETISLAFVAFNAPHFADFVLEAPTALAAGGEDGKVYHYSQRLSLPAKNRLYALA